ncbi:MAG: DUF2948 family protein [Hyphomicrobiaceae bacterium]
MDPLKLIAFDTEDLQVVSAHLQDAVVRVGDMRYLPRERRFAGIMNRFDWAKILAGPDKGPLRRQTALRLERVNRARIAGIDLADVSAVLVLLAVTYETTSEEEPAGRVNLVFADDKAIQLEVECIEAELRDLGPVWQAASRPEHPHDRKN